jgi:protein-disulfide isomerase
MWVFKNMPLQMHPQALVAATAAECAADQEAFWEMHDLLFEQQDQWAVATPEPVLIELADTLGLDAEQFSACLSSREALERVVADLYDGQGVVSSTPTFVVLSGGRGTLLEGSRLADQFAELLQSVLDSADGEESGQ